MIEVEVIKEFNDKQNNNVLRIVGDRFKVNYERANELFGLNEKYTMFAKLYTEPTKKKKENSEETID